jgi:hypothetical protein
LLVSETAGEVLDGGATVAGVEGVRQRTAHATQARDQPERQRLQRGDQPLCKPKQDGFHLWRSVTNAWPDSMAGPNRVGRNRHIRAQP